MAYLEYELSTKQVIEIHENQPIVNEGYDCAISIAFVAGSEFEWTIWVNEVDENKNVVSYSAIRNNPNAKRLLQENDQLKVELGNILIENANDKAKISELETVQGELLLEVATLKMGGIA